MGLKPIPIIDPVPAALKVNCGEGIIDFLFLAGNAHQTSDGLTFKNVFFVRGNGSLLNHVQFGHFSISAQFDQGILSLAPMFGPLITEDKVDWPL